MDPRRTLLGRPVAVAYGVLVALYLLRHVRVQPLQLPAYLLVVAYDLLELAVPALTPYHPVGFPVFLYLLAVLASAVARRLGADGAAPTRVAGGVALVVAAIALGFGAIVGGPVVSATDNPTPLAITATTGLLLAAVGWWLLVGRDARGAPTTD